MMQNRVVGIISKPPADRGLGEVRSVLPWLRKKSELLSGSEDDVLLDVVRNCAYRRAVCDDVLVTQGGQGDCFFIMLSGRTSVFIDTTKSDDDPAQTESAGDALSVGQQPDGEEDQDADEDSSGVSDITAVKKKPLDRAQYGKCIMHYEAGKSFGEIALISEDSVRNATVIADEETDLLVIYRDLFNRSMKAKQEKEYEERKEFISRFKLFSNWSPKFKHLLEMSIRKEEYVYGTQIMKQGDPVPGIVFIVSGQAKVTTEPTLHQQQFPSIMQKVSAIDKELGRQSKEPVEKKEAGSFTQRQIRVRRKEGYAAAERRFMSKSVELCCVEGSEIQGDLEMVMEMSTCACTVTCTASTTAFVLDSKNYDRLVVKKNAHTIEQLKEGVLKKLKSRIATPNGSQIPLLKKVHDDLEVQLKPKQRVYAQPATTIEKDANKQSVIAQMVKLYLKDKTPMIDPVLPDSFYYRLMTDKRNRAMENREKRIQEREKLYFRSKRRIPRSLKQLQNSAAESELLYPSRGLMQSSHSTRFSDRVIRPRTALGIESYSSGPDSGKRRPDTASGRVDGNIFHLTECDVNEDPVANTGAIEKPGPVPTDVNTVIHQLDSFQRDKYDSRSKVVCSATVKTELKNDLSRANVQREVEDFFELNDDDYFDYETSATHLKNLEDRIRSFCSEVRERRMSDPLRVNMLKCFQVKGSESVPLAGGTVVVRQKPCLYPNVKVRKETHQHIRRFMITRGQTPSSSSMSGRPKSAFTRVQNAW